MNAPAQAAGQGRPTYQKNRFRLTERPLKQGPHGSYGMLAYFQSTLPCDVVRQSLLKQSDTNSQRGLCALVEPCA